MQPSNIFSLMLCVMGASAVNMKHFSAVTNDMPASFKTYLEGLLKAYDDVNAAPAFSNYFAPDGLFVLKDQNSERSRASIANLRRTGPDSQASWNHLPYHVSKEMESIDTVLYRVTGKFEKTAGTCSSFDWNADITMLKTGEDVKFEPGKLSTFNDAKTNNIKHACEHPK